MVLGWTVAQQVSAARAAERSWGRTDTVLVVTRRIGPGEVLDLTNTSRRVVPGRLVPDGALTRLPTSRRADSELRRGEILVDSRVAPDGVGATAATLREGTAAVTVALGDAAPPLHPGDVVDVFATIGTDVLVATADATGGATTLTTRVVADDARVLSVRATSTTLAVSEDQVAGTVGANATGGVQLVVVG